MSAATHDRLCDPADRPFWCTCDLIGKVRADEGKRNREADGVAAYLAVEAYQIDLRAKVEALPARGVVFPYYRADVLALIDGDDQ